MSEDRNGAGTLRLSLRAWLADNLTAEVIEARHDGTDQGLARLRDWNRTLADAGWAAPAWPTTYGGRDATVDEQVAYLEEMARAGAPGPVNVIGVANIAPAIMAVGTDEQRLRHLAPMLRGDEIWSQGMSEPDAGSDLASLRTTAVLDGDVFVVNGQKTWNSLGQHADWCQLYVRTDPAARKHRGISCLLVDMKIPGIVARPVRTMTGDRIFSELFFDNVRVPRTALLGGMNEGWSVARTTLSHERAGVASLHLSLSAKLDQLIADARHAGALDNAVWRDRICKVHCQIACMRWTTNRSLAELRAGTPPSALGSLAKLAWAAADQELASLALGVLGMPATSGDWADNLALSPADSIAGGTTEINRSVVGEAGLGLPRDARP